MTSKLPDPIPVTQEGSQLLERLKAVRAELATLSDEVDALELGADYSLYTAADSNFCSWAYDPMFATATGTISTGRLYIAKCKAAKTDPIVSLDTAASAVGSGHTLIKGAVFDAAGAQLGVSADMSASFTTAPIALASPTRDLVLGEVLYLAILAVSSSPPTLRIPVAGIPLNNGLTAAQGYRAGYLDSQTDMPSSITLSSFTSHTLPRWLGAKHA
jgi:hypothetical protein